MSHRLALVSAAVVAGLLVVSPPALAKKGGIKPEKPAAADVGRARAVLVREAGTLEDDAKGRIDVATKRDGRSELRVVAQRLDPGLELAFTIEDDEGVESELGTGVADDDGGARLSLRTHKGAVLPASLQDLAGRRVRVRAALDDSPLLVGGVPAIGGDARKKVRSKAALEAADPESFPDARGKIKLDWRARNGRSRLTIAVRGLPAADLATFLMDDGEGTFEIIGEVVVDEDGEAAVRFRSDHGDAMPLGAADVRDLFGRAVRVDLPTSTALTGSVPE